MFRTRSVVLALGLALAGAAAATWVLSRQLVSTAPEHARELLGFVHEGAQPVAGAGVRFKGTAIAALTRPDGSFRLPAQAGGASRVTAAQQGYFIGGTPAKSSPLTLSLTRLPGQDFEEYRWVDPTPGRDTHSCGNCHEEIYREWSASAHARSATGKHFLNLFDGSDWDGRPNVGWSLLGQHPDGSAVCNSCHVPTMPFEPDAYLDVRKVRGVAARGVHCDYCHKIQTVEDGPFGLTHGRFNLRLLRPAEGQIFFGPLDDVDRGDDAFAPIYRDSRYCASCHEGTVFGVAVYTTYSEWLASPARRAGKQCQTCHMAPTAAMTNFAPGHGGIERDPMTLANHRFFAGGPEQMLRGAISLSGLAHREDGSVRAVVELRADGAGHRLPTGFIDRHLLLVVEAYDAQGKPLPLRDGPVLPTAAGQALAGKPGKLYAKLLKGFDGQSPAPFWRADPAVLDTRLTPGEPDRIAFVFPEETSRLRVQLLHRRFWQQVADAKRWPDNESTVLEREVQISPRNEK